MNETEQDKRFLKQIKKTLDKGSSRLDPGIQSRLTQIRFKAMESKSKGWFPNGCSNPQQNGHQPPASCCLWFFILVNLIKLMWDRV